MNRLALAAALACLPATAAETFTVDPNHTFPSFEVMHLGFSVQRGRFNRTSGRITLDTAARTGTADITIDAASISTGVEKLEQHLRREDFFNVEKFPTITFKSERFVFEGEKVRSVAGELTILGVTRPVSLTANYFSCGDHPLAKRKACGGDFVTTVKRTEFGMKYAVPAVADEVTLRINVEALKD
jgi:polyisoprenoid-binding protein YceI